MKISICSISVELPLFLKELAGIEFHPVDNSHPPNAYLPSPTAHVNVNIVKLKYSLIYLGCTCINSKANETMWRRIRWGGEHTPRSKYNNENMLLKILHKGIKD